MRLKSYQAKTHQGPFLNINEDAIDVDLVNNLYMLFDGFGGGGIGDKAVELVKDSIKHFYTKVGHDPEATMPIFYSHKYLLEGNALINAMHIAHGRLMKKNQELDMNSRGGTSAACVSLSDGIATVASVGNCATFLCRKGKIKSVTKPDNFELLSCDNYDREFVTAPMSGFGLFEDLHISLKEVRVTKGDQLILMSDGIYARVEKEEIVEMLHNSSQVLQDRIEDVFSLGNSRGNLDNQSLLILNF